MAMQYGNGSIVGGRSSRAQDWANLLLAIWLFISPWVLTFGHGVQVGPAGVTGGTAAEVSNAAWNAWVLGVLTFLVALSAISSMELWQEWIALIFGAWIFAAPWALGFTHLAAASWDHWLTGAAIFLIAASSLSRPRRVPVDTTAPLDDPRRPLP
ncbi:MAG TPA: SPW repeat protein [Terriglobales bacterium]|nr:SPW repeat protein [Terriglobales bacterium]